MTDEPTTAPTTAHDTAPSERARLRRAPAKAAYDRPTIDAILDATPHCHLGYVLPDGQPVVVPTLQARLGDRIVLHASSGGRLGMAAAASADGWPVCVTVTLLDGIVAARSGFHHSANHRSVVVLGNARLLTDDTERLTALEAITDHVIPGRWAELRAPNAKELAATAVVELPLDEAAAKIRTGDPVDEPEDHDANVWAGVLPIEQRWGAPIPSADLRPGIAMSPSIRAVTSH